MTDVCVVRESNSKNVVGLSMRDIMIVLISKCSSCGSEKNYGDMLLLTDPLGSFELDQRYCSSCNIEVDYSTKEIENEKN